MDTITRLQSRCGLTQRSLQRSVRLEIATLGGGPAAKSDGTKLLSELPENEARN